MHPQFDTDILWAFTLLWLAIVPTPGANSLMVTHVAMTRPASHVALAIAGNVCGIVLLAAGALLGWAAALETFPWLRRSVNSLGAGYLIYFGCRLLLRRRETSIAGVATAPEMPTTLNGRRTFMLGLVTALSNAQAIIFITSIFAVTGVLQANVATGLATVAIMIICNSGYLAMLGWMFQAAAVRRGYARFRRVLEGAMGTLFIVFGGRLLLREFVWRP